ncbi:Oidioi.mRNA.OKI2018_I69.PAR.g9642.t1.cds [Oikopleura dioica]|uniref:Oidioi.mRNA.OKI2018_I69.PAR.g9642.t1.cds n=1 Tax=Oikopleura dioica TaxID=34765 RepID=A0ABN7RQQ5_OIKDI|nr:Oidioi.mRNA.OKI2018_I69.PAR.g9642.t1.cds [Oikopleura dioica]
MIKSIATFSALAAVARAQTYPYPSLTPTGDQWTAWSEWAGCDNLSLEDFCSFPDNYLANSVRYRECRLIDSEDHEWDPAQNASQVQPPKGDPAQTLNFDGLLTNGKQESPSNNPVLRFDSLAILDWRKLEAAISTDPELFRPYIPAPYKRIVFEFALCINVHKCPKPLPWSSWNCHCLGTGEDNTENLPFADVTPARPPDHEFNFARIGTETTESLAILLEGALRITRKTEALSSRINV